MVKVRYIIPGHNVVLVKKSTYEGMKKLIRKKNRVIQMLFKALVEEQRISKETIKNGVLDVEENDSRHQSNTTGAENVSTASNAEKERDVDGPIGQVSARLPRRKAFEKGLAFIHDLCKKGK